jgi:hypothetical protein
MLKLSNWYLDKLSLLLKDISILNNISKQSKLIIWMIKHLITKLDQCLIDLVFEKKIIKKSHPKNDILN